MNTYHRPPSEESLFALEALQSAVTQTLEKKKKLGLYAVVWKNGALTVKRIDDTSDEAPIDAEESFQQGFKEALVGETRPIETLWDT